MVGSMRPLRSVRAWCFVAAVVLVSQFVPVASRAATGSISGSVEDVGGSAIRGICVAVFDAGTAFREQQTVTDANGMYTADGLAAGDYNVRFTDCAAPFDFALEWNGGVRDQSQAPPITVALGDVEVDAAMDRLGAITGSVEDVGGSAIRGICVKAFDDHGRGVGWARTDANGMYMLKIRSLLGTGSYRVRFKDCVAPFDFAPEWNDGRRLLRRVPFVTVAVGHETEVNAALDRWGAISGTVTAQATSQPLSVICVKVFRRVRLLGKWHPEGVGWARTSPDGTYTVNIRKPWPPALKVRFSDCIQPRGFVTEFYDNFFTPWNPTFVRVQLGRTTRGIDAALILIITVPVDIKPGSSTNPINLSSNATIPVAILSTSSFDATSVDPSSVCFGDAETPAERDCVALHTSTKDVNGDGHLDLLLHFKTRQTGIDHGDTEACLTGTTFTGLSIQGCDSILPK
jgi:hypothetical protein